MGKKWNYSTNIRAVTRYEYHSKNADRVVDACGKW